VSVLVHGWDLALNHGAIVQLKDGELDDFWYYTDKAGSAGKSADHGTRMPVLDKIKDRQQKIMLRLAWLEHYMDKEILVPHRPDYVGIEDYALDAAHGSHYMGEFGGIARILVWFRGIPFRLHDPISIKMFTTHDGTAQKDLIEEKVLERWGADFGPYNQPKAEPSKRNPEPKQNRQTSEDLADAFATAQLVWIEYQLRTGKILMADLPHPKEIQVFNRVTKSYPVNLLAREWLHNDKGASKPHGGLRPRVEAKIKELTKLAPKAAAMLKELLKDG
jgi:Holliday junction resolvasome RuvABC endonuclease subunit